MKSFEGVSKFLRTGNNRYRLLSLLIVLLAIPASVFLVQQTIRFFTGAQEIQARIFIQPVSTDLEGPTAFKVFVDPQSNPIAFAAVNVTFDTTKVRLVNNPEMGTTLQTVHVVTDVTTANANGEVQLAAGMAASQTTPPTELFELTQLTFEPVTGQGDNISTSLNLTNAQLVEKTNATELNTSVAGSSLVVNPTTSTASPSAVPTGTVALEFTGAPSTVQHGQDFNVPVYMDTNNENIVGLDLVVNFDATRLSVTSATNGVFDQKIAETIDNSSGVYRVSVLNDTSSPTVNSSSAQVLTLVMNAKSAGSASMSFSTDSVVAGTGEAGQNLTVSGTPVSITVSQPTATPTATPLPSGTPTNTPEVTPTPTPIVTPTGTPVVSRNEDINQDGFVNIQDYVVLFQYYGLTNPSVARADINRDGRVNIRDYALLYEAFE